MKSQDYSNKIYVELQEENPDWDLIDNWSTKKMALEQSEAMREYFETPESEDSTK